jgi:hypothetical protein
MSIFNDGLFFLKNTFENEMIKEKETTINAQIFSSIPYSKTPSAYVPPSM